MSDSVDPDRIITGFASTLFAQIFLTETKGKYDGCNKTESIQSDKHLFRDRKQCIIVIGRNWTSSGTFRMSENGCSPSIDSA